MVTEHVEIIKEHKIEWDDAKVSRLWDYYSRTPPYSDVYFSKLFGHHILRHSGLPLGEPLDVLDFGCGPGFIWDHLSQLKANWQYTALDFSSNSVSKLREKGSGQPRFKGVHLVSTLPTELPESHFDVVLLFEVVEHLKDDYLAGTLTEVARLLKPGGIVVITTPNEEDISKSEKFCPECGSIFHEWQHVRSWSVASLSACLKQYSFKLCVAKTLDFTTQGITALTVLRRAKRIVRRLLKGEPGTPHMIAVFQKV